METLNKKTLAELISTSHNLTKKESTEIIDLVFESIAGALKKEDKVDIAGFGKFEVKTRAARTGINPQTKETIEIPASKTAAFKASKTLKDSLK